MLKKIIACVLMLAVLGVVPMMIGCEKTDIKTHRQTEVRDRVVDQHTVVE